MPFAIVQYRKSIEIVPETWITIDENGKTLVWWPPKNLCTLQQDEKSMPVFEGEMKWKIGPEIIKRSGIRSYAEAEKESDRMEILTETEEDSDGVLMQTRSVKKTHSSTSSSSTAIPTFNVPTNLFTSAPPGIPNNGQVTLPSAPVTQNMTDNNVSTSTIFVHQNEKGVRL